MKGPFFGWFIYQNTGQMGCRYRYIDLDANSTDLDANFPQSPSEPNWGLQCLRGQNTKHLRENGWTCTMADHFNKNEGNY